MRKFVGPEFLCRSTEARVSPLDTPPINLYTDVTLVSLALNAIIAQRSIRVLQVGEPDREVLRGEGAEAHAPSPVASGVAAVPRPLRGPAAAGDR